MIDKSLFEGARFRGPGQPRIEEVNAAPQIPAGERLHVDPPGGIRPLDPEEIRARPASIPLPVREDPFLAAARRGEPEITALYNAKPLIEIHREIAARNYPRGQLADLLASQNRARGASRLTLENIEELRDPETCAVVTGQQVGLLGGPLYTLYKALAVIRESEELRRRGIRAVPLFWMASYDHDLKEVSRIGMLTGAHEPEMLELQRGPSQLPVGDLKLGEGICRVLDRVAEIVEHAPFAGEIMAKLREIYRPEETYAGAFAKWLGFLTDRFGLVILDPNCREFQSLARPVLERELFLESAEDSIDEANRKIRELGFEPQIAHRRGHLSVFFIDADGRRVPLTRTAEGFRTGGRPALLSSGDARRILAAEPERFSPSALLRPIVEDHVIPTIAYVGGPSERKYYAQVGGLYRSANLPNPAILSRPSFSVIDRESAAAFELATHTPLPSIIGQPPGDAIGRAGVPSAVNKSYASLLELRETIEKLDRELDDLTRQGSRTWVERRTSDLRQGLFAALRRATDAARGAGLERLEKGLARARERIETCVTSLRLEVEKADPKRGRHPPHWPLRSILRELNRLERQLWKVGRKERADLVSTLYRLSPRGSPQERTMTIAQLVAEHGTDVVGLLLERADTSQKNPELVITTRQSPGGRG